MIYFTSDLHFGHHNIIAHCIVISTQKWDYLFQALVHVDMQRRLFIPILLICLLLHFQIKESIYEQKVRQTIYSNSICCAKSAFSLYYRT